MNEESLFAAASEKATPAERAALLEEACGGDDALRRRVEQLLAADQRSQGILECEPNEGVISGTQREHGVTLIAEGPGTLIGPYKLKEQIGEGGFGLVFVAEQQRPVRRKVALKIIKPGMDTREVITRFEVERQALALMDHPNIAKILDAGWTGSRIQGSGVRSQGTGVRSQESGVRRQESGTSSQGAGAAALTPDPCLLTPDLGRPYFVMELVRGVPMTDYCDQQQLTTRDRLELFVGLCHAVQHAHQKGIIHRDLKPSNVMVTLHDGKPVIKVIDFGVAKALNQRLTEHSVYTRFAQMMGTPAYMSPEQAEMSGLDVDTRSDIYSLGVLLYELLTGSTPFDKKRLATASFDELRRIIREEEPEKPSTRLTQSTDTLFSVAAQRKTEPAKLTRLIRGELDWIAMRALEKDRTRRYESANDFARDVQRYLADEPVEACPPSMSYRLKKFVRRNKGPVIATCLVLMALMAGMFGTIVGLIQAHAGREAALQAEKAERQQRHVALENLQKARDAAAAEEQAKIAAQKSEAETRAVLYFLERTIFGKGPLYSSERFQTATLREAIESVAAALDKEFEKQPLVEARLRRTVGWSFWFMAENKKAAEHFEKSLRLYTVHRGPDHPDTILGQTILAGVYHLLGRDPEAVKLREDALSRQKAKFGLKHHRTIDNMNELATLYFRLGRDTDAFAILDEWIQHGVAPKNAEMFFVPLGRQLRALQKAKDGAGCRRMAELLEKSQPLDAPISLYHAARFRAVTAAVLRDADKSEKGLQAAAREADQAMAWLEQAVALGFNGVVAIKRSPDLQALRDREDFRQLVATLETGSGKK